MSDKPVAYCGNPDELIEKLNGIERRAAEIAAPHIAAAEQRAADAEQYAEKAEQGYEQRLADLRTEWQRQWRVADHRAAKHQWLAQYLPEPLRVLADAIPVQWREAPPRSLTPEWLARVERRAAPSFDPRAESDLLLLREAAQRIIESQSAAQFQRKMRVGFATAARLLDELEVLGVISPPKGAKGARKVLASADMLGDKLRQIDDLAHKGLLFASPALPTEEATR